MKMQLKQWSSVPWLFSNKAHHLAYHYLNIILFPMHKNANKKMDDSALCAKFCAKCSSENEKSSTTMFMDLAKNCFLIFSYVKTFTKASMSS